MQTDYDNKFNALARANGIHTNEIEISCFATVHGNCFIIHFPQTIRQIGVKIAAGWILVSIFQNDKTLNKSIWMRSSAAHIYMPSIQ